MESRHSGSSTLRSAIFVSWMALSVVPYASLLVLISVLVRGRPLYRFGVAWLDHMVRSARYIVGVQWRVQGLENLEGLDGPVVLCPKHQSTWETFALPCIMPHPIAYVFKRELLWIPFFGWAIGRMDMVHIDRGKPVEAWNKVVTRGRELAAKGVWIIMFPEGTRSERGSQRRYKTGPARLALATGATLVPVAVTSGQCWPRRSFRLRPGTIDISIGPPIASTGREAEELIGVVEQWVEGEMRRLTPADY